MRTSMLCICLPIMPTYASKLHACVVRVNVGWTAAAPSGSIGWCTRDCGGLILKGSQAEAVVFPVGLLRPTLFVYNLCVRLSIDLSTYQSIDVSNLSSYLTIYAVARVSKWKRMR